MERIEVLVIREGNNDVAVVVSCEKSRTVQNGNQLLESLIKAVTKWVQTDEGKPVFGYATDDLNIGDLASHGTDEVFKCLLEDEGIHGFQIIQPDRCDWNYDTPLVDTNSLPEDFGVDDGETNE